ncbi:hypothetical protein QCA50_002794 [Cerrena zonata]|uniref:High-temperature-induced dauer-formation protein-domain-containing protein n=1 Tax=Cerrena zonata TaxID=2478898 RepID=A0AAW0GSP6_9APHY
MFANLPQRIHVPFNLLGDEAKLAFRSQPGGIAKLATVRNISDTDTYWDQYILLFDSPSDVFSLISSNDVKRALYEAPENVATLIKVITSRLFNLVSDHTFPTNPTASVASFATSFIKSSTGSQERNTNKEVLNCIRVLQRVLPVIFEIEADSSKFEMEVLWKKEVVNDHHEVDETTRKPQFVIEDDDDDEEPSAAGSSSHARPSGSSSGPKSTKSLPAVAEKLFTCLVDLLFCCGFTLPTKIQVDHYKINYTIWEKGIGSTTDPGPSPPYESNRTEVLRLLLVLFSKQIYVPPVSLFSTPSLYSLHFVQRTPRRDVLTILCSLINTVMNSALGNNNHLMSGVTGRLPYNHLVFKGEDPRSSLVATCFQVLCVLLDFQSGTGRDVVTTHGENEMSGPTARSNAFRYFIAKLHRTNDFAFILSGIIAIFEEQMAAMNNLLPGSKKSVPYMAEAVIFFWKMVELNKKFRAFVLDSEKATDILPYLFCYGLEIKDKPEQHGLCRAISYIFQSLSAEKSFGLKLTSPIKAHIPQKWAVLGTAADFMIQSVYSMIATTSGTLSSLYPAFVIALVNAAPYFKNLSVNSSARLLISDEGHPRLLFFTLEAFNSIILRNLSDNPNLVYAIIRAHKSFEDLGTFTLAGGLREIRRKQQAKEERARQDSGVDKGKQRADADLEEGPHEEKARLLRNEQNNSIDLPRRTESIETLPEASEQSTGGPAPASVPTSPNSANIPSSREPSEKARGKMRAGRSLSSEMTGSLEQLASAGVGRNGFVPTQEWVTSWQQGLPLDPILLLCSELVPKVSELQASLNPANANTAIMDLLRSANLEQELPAPTPLSPRRFVWSDASVVWLTSLIWGEIYIKGMTPLGIWNNTSVRLFYVKHTQSHQRQITETVTNVVGGLLRRTDSSQSVRHR